MQVRLMNTVKMKIPYSCVKEALVDLRRWKIRHYPFRRQQGGMEIEMFPNPKVNLLMLKYPIIVDTVE